MRDVTNPNQNKTNTMNTLLDTPTATEQTPDQTAARLRGQLVVLATLLSDALGVITTVEPESDDEEQRLADLQAKGRHAIGTVLRELHPQAEPTRQPADDTAAEAPMPLSDLQHRALAICQRSAKVSVSEVQRKLAIGYAQAHELCQSLINSGHVPGMPISPSLAWPTDNTDEKGPAA